MNKRNSDTAEKKKNIVEKKQNTDTVEKKQSVAVTFKLNNYLNFVTF